MNGHAEPKSPGPEDREALSESATSKNFRPDPHRAIFVQGLIEQGLIDRLTPEIIRLQHESRDPITIYIDSPGGETASAATLLQLLSAPSQDSSKPCQLITVATSRASSAAAALLSSGDYALAYPASVVHYHGVRTVLSDPLTLEVASQMAKHLKLINDQFAMSLARQSNRRFFFRYVSLIGRFEEYRDRAEKPISDLECFIGLLSENLSPRGLEVIEQAQRRTKRYENLSSRILKSRSVTREINKLETRRMARLEAEILKTIISFELKQNQDKDWTFSRQGLAQLNDDFVLLNEYIGHHRQEWISEFCARWGDFVLTDEDKKEIECVSEDKREQAKSAKLTPILLPLWLLFGAICHTLQEGENPLPPRDAFWLGLIDEVIGADDLPALRLVVEFKPQLDGRTDAEQTEHKRVSNNA